MNYTIKLSYYLEANKNMLRLADEFFDFSIVFMSSPAALLIEQEGFVPALLM